MTRSTVSLSRTNTTLEVLRTMVFKVQKNYQDDEKAFTGSLDQRRSPKNAKILYSDSQGSIRPLRSKNVGPSRSLKISRTTIKPLDPLIKEEVLRMTRSTVCPSRTNTTLEVQRTKVFEVLKNFQDDNKASTRSLDKERSPKNDMVHS